MLGLLPVHWQVARAVWLWKGRLQETKKTTYWQTLLDAQKLTCRDLNLRPSRLKSDTLTITLQDPCLQGILLSHSLSISIYVYLSLSIYLYPSLSVYLPWYLHLCASWVPIVASSVAHFSCRGQRCHVLEAPLFLQTNITSDDNKQKGNRNTASCSHFITFWRQLRCIHT